jgi:glycosyltransferase involved in cell wall biosynthesis
MKKILLLSKYSRMGASSRLRTHQYIPYLELHNYAITVSSLFNDIYLESLYGTGKVSKALVVKLYLKRLLVLLTSFKYDVLWIEKELFPYLPATFEKLLRLFNVRYVVDYDDAIFHNYDMSSNPVIKTLLCHKIDKVMAMSSVTVVGNQYLANRAKSAGAKNVHVIPTVVDIDRYDQKVQQESKLVIGWIGSPSTQKYVADLYGAFSKLALTHSFELHLVGATNDMIQTMADIDIVVVPWSEASEVFSILKMDIGIMPLVEGPWEKGKCGYKLIQYMACGIPVVASDVGVNREIVLGGSCGLLASNDQEWYENLARLLDDSLSRVELGKSGRESVSNCYSVQAQRSKIKQLLEASGGKIV